MLEHLGRVKLNLLLAVVRMGRQPVCINQPSLHTCSLPFKLLDEVFSFARGKRELG